ncbi:MAG: hypothetical protein JOZ32_22050 [Bryobacterales bacterium]|nr:hypothetical protein [Bryobacterales bacterium]
MSAEEPAPVDTGLELAPQLIPEAAAESPSPEVESTEPEAQSPDADLKTAGEVSVFTEPHASTEQPESIGIQESTSLPHPDGSTTPSE